MHVLLHSVSLSSLFHFVDSFDFVLPLGILQRCVRAKERGTATACANALTGRDTVTIVSYREHKH